MQHLRKKETKPKQHLLNISQIRRRARKLRQKHKEKLQSKSCKSICQLGPQTGFHGDEMARFNWLDKRTLASESTTWEGLENIHIPVCLHAQTHKHTHFKWGSQTIYARLGESQTVSPVRWEARIECVDTDMVYCQAQALTHAHWPVSLF